MPAEGLNHECGLAVLRLHYPLGYYREKYGDALWGLRKMYLLMEKQHNRGQDGAGLATVKLEARVGRPYFARKRVIEPTPAWPALVASIERKLADGLETLNLTEIDLPLKRLYNAFPWAGEVFLGHLRYGTHGKRKIDMCHPLVRTNNWRSRTLLLAGNFNLTNVEVQFRKLFDLGQHPRQHSDTATMLERVGHFVDKENQRLFDQFKAEQLSNRAISEAIAREMDLFEVLRRAAKYWDGGYVIGGLLGHGDAFVMRDPWGIRPAFYYTCEEFTVAASERPAIATTFDLPTAQIQELQPAHALVIKRVGKPTIGRFTEPQTRKSCSFERIYFSRGTDPDIYQERKTLGRLLAPKIIDAIDGDLQNTVFSHIPNTSLPAFRGMCEALEQAVIQKKLQSHQQQGLTLNPMELGQTFGSLIRTETVIVKDTLLRTFITDKKTRNRMVEHVYDITYGALRPGLDQLVIIDDSIVRGTTLQKSILRILDKLNPKRIVVVSSAPQIRYPDCYGIDMSEIGSFVAFQAAIRLLQKTEQKQLIDEVYRLCKTLEQSGTLESENVVRRLYAPFSDDQLSEQIAQLLRPVDFKPELRVVYQSVEGLHQALPPNYGDWYFTGDYPTPGGNRVANRAFMNFYEGKNKRAY